MNSIPTEQLTTFTESLITGRRSVRAFTKQSATPELLEKIFSIAQTAPSNCNTQPWQVHVASGEKLEQLRTAFPEATMQGKISLDFPYEPKYQGVYQDRQYDAANQMYSAMGIERQDKPKRNAAFMNNFNFFGAPHVAFIFLPEEFGIREAADVGMYAQNLMLTIQGFGLASCPQTSLSYQADLVREVLDIDPSNKLLFGISFGYENTEEKVNNTRVGRATLSESTHFHK